MKSLTYAASLKHFNLTKQASTIVMMMNLGGPNTKDEISPFLERFFSDTTVIRIPFGMGPYIAKLRGPAKINKQYDAIGGKSPLLDWTMKQGQMMTQDMQDVDFIPAFRYGLPLQEDSIHYIMETQKQAKNLVLFSQYPQYSCTTGGNAIRNAIRSLKQYEHNLQVSVIDEWHNHASYINALSMILEQDIKDLDLDKTIILFTAHSLPASNIWEGDMYPYYIYETCQLIQQNLKQRGVNIEFHLGYQSKVGLQQWVGPSTQDVLDSLLKKKQYENIVVSPVGFTSDHLETLYELDIQILPEYQAKTNQQIRRASSLNDHPEFIKALKDILQDGIRRKHKGNRKRCPGCKFEECDIVNQ